MKEDNAAAWAWLILLLSIVAFVAAFDLWAHFTGHKMMTTQFRLWLFNPVTGPFVVGGFVGIYAGLWAHWLIRKSS